MGVLAIAGFPFTSGFISKDEILLATYQRSHIMFWLAAFCAVLTAIYMFRLLMLVFFGGFRGTQEQEHHMHESPKAITIPLIILAILSIVGGFVQLPQAFGGHDFFNEFLAPIVPAVIHESAEAAMREYYLLGGTIVGLAIIFLVTKKLFAVTEFNGEYKGIKKAMANKWYVDEIYNAIIVNPLNALGIFFKNIIEKRGIDGLVNGVGTFINYSSQR